MGNRRQKPNSFLRQLTGWVAAYSIAFHTVLFGIAGLQASQAELFGSGLSGIVICHTDTGDDSNPENRSPAQSGDCQFHCVLCASGPAVLAVPSVVSGIAPANRSVDFGVAGRDGLPASFLYLVEPPRGPPPGT